jgi:hypothetical protein
MSSFDSMAVWNAEAPYTIFDLLEQKTQHRAVKRTANCYSVLAEIPDHIGVVYCVRHPYDTLTSKLSLSAHLRYYHVTEDRWLAEFAAYRSLVAVRPRRRLIVLRYEDLVNDPNTGQEAIAAKFSLRIAIPFKAYPLNRPIATTSVGRWRNDAEAIDRVAHLRLDTQREITHFCKLFHYDIPVEPKQRELDANALAPIWRLDSNPIINPRTKGYAIEPNRGHNINGPSLIKTPAWLPGRRAEYYLYFAHHRGSYIRLAVADKISGPWTILETGTLRRDQVGSCSDHIASPDVHVDEDSRTIRMYFHGGAKGKSQQSYVATSKNGIDFEALPGAVAPPYLRMLFRNGTWIGMANDGHFYRSRDGLKDFTRCSRRALDSVVGSLAENNGLRHVALTSDQGSISVYYSRRGDSPESIRRCRVDTTADWQSWSAQDDEEILRPVFAWEGSCYSLSPSKGGISIGPENAVRDPAFFVDGKTSYILYSVAGESGIAVARLRPKHLGLRSQRTRIESNATIA